MNEVQIFGFEGADVRVVTVDNEPWFVAKDVAEVLGYLNTTQAITDHCKGVAKRYPLQTTGGKQEVRIIRESDVYRLVMRSKLPTAEKFEAWVMEEVLPSIRKNGGYIAGQEKMSDLELLTQAVMVAQRLITEKDQKIALDAPKVEAFDALMKTVDHLTITNVAKHFSLPPKLVVFPFLRKHGYLTSRDLPTQKSINEDLMQIRTVKTSDNMVREQAVVMYPQLDNWRKNVLPRMQAFAEED